MDARVLRDGDSSVFSGCFEAGSTSEQRGPVKRERSHSHDSASSSLSSKASGEPPLGNITYGTASDFRDWEESTQGCLLSLGFQSGPVRTGSLEYSRTDSRIA